MFVNFSIHLSDDLVERLNQTAKESGRPRNALIREAISEWLNRRRPAKWPQEIVNFRGIRGTRRFEADRKNLNEPRDPFDALST
jgi:hypothetical protein